MAQTLRIPRKLAIYDWVLITLRGMVNAVLDVQIDALLYNVYPGGKMGHVGIIASIAAVVIGS